MKLIHPHREYQCHGGLRSGRLLVAKATKPATNLNLKNARGSMGGEVSVVKHTAWKERAHAHTINSPPPEGVFQYTGPSPRLGITQHHVQ